MVILGGLKGIQLYKLGYSIYITAYELIGLDFFFHFSGIH